MVKLIITHLLMGKNICCLFGNVNQLITIIQENHINYNNLHKNIISFLKANVSTYYKLLTN